MSDLKVRMCVLGQVSTNCYLVYKDSVKQAVIIDPADNSSFILNKCRELGVTPAAVLLTHGHFDHILAVEDICRAFHIEVYAAAAESRLLSDPSLNLTEDYGVGRTVKADVAVKDGDIIETGGLRFRVIATPGHTEGSVCYLLEEENTLFSGDTLFEESVGRTDLPTGSTAAIVESVRGLFSLPDDTMVYPGHGDETTIGHEKKYNPVAGIRG